MLTKPKSYLLLAVALAAGVLFGALARPMPTRAQDASPTTGLLASILEQLLVVPQAEGQGAEMANFLVCALVAAGMLLLLRAEVRRKRNGVRRWKDLQSAEKRKFFIEVGGGLAALIVASLVVTGLAVAHEHRLLDTISAWDVAQLLAVIFTTFGGYLLVVAHRRYRRSNRLLLRTLKSLPPDDARILADACIGAGAVVAGALFGAIFHAPPAYAALRQPSACDDIMFAAAHPGLDTSHVEDVDPALRFLHDVREVSPSGACNARSWVDAWNLLDEPARERLREPLVAALTSERRATETVEIELVSDQATQNKRRLEWIEHVKARTGARVERYRATVGVQTSPDSPHPIRVVDFASALSPDTVATTDATSMP